MPVSRLPSSQSLLLPPLQGASDVTRRIENGLPRRGPAGTPSVKQPPTKHQTAQTQIARTPPVKLRPAVTNPSPGRTKARRPRIAVVIDDMSSDRTNQACALCLPPQVTLAYLPFAADVATQVSGARLKGHRVMLHLPMEAPGHRGKPSVNVLSVTSGPEKLRRQLTDILGRFGGYTGVNNHMGSKFTRDRERMDIMVSELQRRGLYFLDSRPSCRSFENPCPDCRDRADRPADGAGDCHRPSPHRDDEGDCSVAGRAKGEGVRSRPARCTAEESRAKKTGAVSDGGITWGFPYPPEYSPWSAPAQTPILTLFFLS
jgi:hypothetical protein